MGLASNARYSSAMTRKAYSLVEAVEVNLLDTGYYEVVGTCGHRLVVIHKHQVEDWNTRISTRTRFRKRCESCIKDPEAHRAKLMLG